MQNLKVTLIQQDLVWENPEANLNNLEKKILEIQEETDLIILPEMFATGFSMKPQLFAPKYYETIINWMQKIAGKKRAVVTGTVIAKEDDKYFNRLIWMPPDSSFQFYDKRHLFSFAGEDKFYGSGNQHLITKIKNWRFRPLICYDLRFPVWSRNKNDYDVLIYVANWPEKRNEAWKILLKARAIENQSYVLAVNRTGTDGNGVFHSGDSCVIDPKGKIISNFEAGKEAIETIELNYSELTEFRNKFKVFQDSDKFNILLS